MSPEMKRSHALVKEAFDLVGEGGLRTIIIELGKAQLIMAMALLHEDSWWVARMTSALDSPTGGQNAFLSKMLDKLLPSPSSVKPEVDTPEQFIIQYEKPHDPQERGAV
jgi:hypothetical protein